MVLQGVLSECWFVLPIRYIFLVSHLQAVPISLVQAQIEDKLSGPLCAPFPGLLLLVGFLCS